MDPWNVIKNLGIKHYTLKDKILIEGNKFCKPLEKVAYTCQDDNDSEE